MSATPTELPLPSFTVEAASGPVGGWLRHFWKNWSSIQVDGWVASILKDGYFFPFEGHPSPLMLVPLYLQQIYRVLTPQWSDPGSDVSRSVFSSQPNLPDPQEDWRVEASDKPKHPQLICIVSPRFRVQTTSSIMRSMFPGTWSTSVDL